MASQISLGNTNPQNGGGIASTAAGADSLTNQLAGMSKHQLYQIVSQMKDLIHQNQHQAREILIANPQLTKTLFQAQVMLGMVRAPETSPPASASARSPQQTPSGSQGPEVPPTSPPQPRAVPQQLPNQQPAPQQAPPQMTSPYLQQSQASSAAVQPNQPAFVFQQSVQPQQQASPLTNMTTHSQPSATSTLQPPLQQHGASQPLLSLHPPPLPQQPRPLAPPSQMQHPNTQGIGFASHPAVPQSYQPQSQYLSIHQQQGGSPQTNAGPPFQQMLTPPLPTQPSPQQMFQVPSRSGNVNISSSGIVAIGGALDTGRGLNMGIPNTSAPLNTWNQAPPSSLPMGSPHVTPAGATGHMVAGHHPFGGTSMAPGSNPNPNLNPPHVFNQAMAQPQPPQQQLQHQQQMQMPIELEQQKVLLQQVMNLTPEQLNSLPPEQRQQVLQLQQAFRSQSGGG